MKEIPLKIVFGSLLLALPISGYALDQWASKVVAFSSQYDEPEWSAKQALGAPNVVAYGDNNKAWAPKTSDAGKEFLTLEFAKPVYSTGVTIRETSGYGFVTGVDVIDTNNVSHRAWRGTDTSVDGKINNFQATWPRTAYLVKAVKVSMNTALRGGWEEIDAVRLHGVEPLSGSLAPRLGHAAKLTCTNLTTGQNLSVSIKGTGTTDPVNQWDCEKAGLAIGVGDKVRIQIVGQIAE